MKEQRVCKGPALRERASKSLGSRRLQLDQTRLDIQTSLQRYLSDYGDTYDL